MKPDTPRLLCEIRRLSSSCCRLNHISATVRKLNLGWKKRPYIKWSLIHHTEGRKWGCWWGPLLTDSLQIPSSALALIPESPCCAVTQGRNQSSWKINIYFPRVVFYLDEFSGLIHHVLHRQHAGIAGGAGYGQGRNGAWKGSRIA